VVTADPRLDAANRTAVERMAAVRLVFDASTGPAVILGLADLGDRFRMISSEVDVVEPDAPLPHLPVARAVWRPRPDLGTAAEAWLTAGGPHHTAMTTSLPIEPIADFADIADVELVTIDATTTSAAFRRELRWNQAYYYLNRRP
jgi:L-arabinose isomerase